MQLKRHIEATLGSGNIIEAVRLPPGEDLKEWLAVNTVDFYNAISILYATLEEFCTERTCEVMSAGGKVRSERDVPRTRPRPRSRAVRRPPKQLSSCHGLSDARAWLHRSTSTCGRTA